MKVCLLTDKPDHPTLAAATSLLAGRGHEVVWLDPDAPAAAPAGGDLADVYLLKAHTPAALALARCLEARGARVVNSASATALCQDRGRIAEVAERAGVPMPATRTLRSLSLLRPGDAPARTAYPFMVKSRHSRRGDLVARVDGPDRLRALIGTWPDEPVVVQEFVDNSGWDHKVWVVDGRLFTQLRPSPGTPRPPAGPVVTDLPPAWAELALRAGEVFGLEVYGIDLPDRVGAPVVVDVNAFPGIRGPEGAPRALAGLVSGPTRTR
ncbi:alpha-L-glutamate ligase [Streptomyces sp. NPDC020403]|uniref:ATP-grasp domain-containing protein n=1 Tax=unclassified Streptomyces TaxID=2593676 RepID=UPI0033C2B799